MNKASLLLVLLAVSFVAAVETSADNDAADQLIREISRMENAVRIEQTNHKNLWDTQSQDCTTEIGFRNEEVSAAQDALTRSTDTLNKCSTAKASSEADKAKAETYVESIQQIMESLRVQRATDKARFDRILNEEIDPAIEAINGVYPILDEFTNGQVTFIQITNHINKSFIQMVQAGKGAQFATVLAHLATQQKGISQETIEQLTKLFDDLLDDLTEERAQLIATEEAAIAAYNTAIEGYNNILTSLHATIESLTTYIGEMTTCVQTERGISASAEAKKNRNQDALNHAVDMCAAFQTEYDHSTQARNEEIALLGKLKTFVREQADLFGNYGTDNVDAFKEYQKSFAETRAKARANFLQLSLLQYKSSDFKTQQVPSKCEDCRKSFIQKKLGF